ncbi:uncharacterized protein RSE6_07627 [Rhynchosporium secalis]|uniref:Uncharacterized protein n=1 Tax=Rhynchosporium secalis TaxID=38038 RepID=A0A1E1MDF7_RHYSE|nr:uncharacterized protein RSE6_07627 [Rhynchosporium secalis]
MSSSFQLPLFSTSVPGYPSASAGLTIADYLITNEDGSEPMDWQPEGILAVEAWKYQAITLPALVAAGGPFALPPLYTYHPLPINFSAMAAFHHLSSLFTTTTSQVHEVELALASWQQQQMVLAIEQDRVFLATKYGEAVKKEKSLADVLDVVRMQMELQKRFAGDGEGLRRFVEQQQQPQQQQQQQDQQQLIKEERGEALRQKQADQLAASASLSLSLSSPPPLPPLLSSSVASVTTSTTPPPPPPQVKPGVSDQGSAFRGLCAPSVVNSAPESSSSSSLSSVLPEKFSRQLAGMFNLV